MYKDYLAKVKNQKVFWCFDATSSILKQVQGNKRPFLYSMIWHDKDKKLLNNLFDFVSCCHRAVTISNYLNLFRANLLLYGDSKKLLPYPIVHDCAFAYFNAVQVVFNKMTLNQYLDHVYDFLFNNLPWSNQIEVLEFLDSVHFLHNVTKRTKKLKKPSFVKIAFNFMFTILQNCITVEEFKHYYECIIMVLSFKKQNFQFEQAFKTLNDVLRNRIDSSELNSEEINSIDDHEDGQNDSEEEYDILEDEPSTDSEIDDEVSKKTTEAKKTSKIKSKKVENSIRNQSKFNTFFEKFTEDLIIQIEKTNEIDFNNASLKDNQKEYYCPQYLKYLKSLMYLFPFWCGVLLNKDSDKEIDQNIITRVHSNFVEGKFKITKHSILNHLKDNMPHEIITKFYKDIAVNSMMYNVTNSTGINLSLDMIEDNWGCIGDRKKKGIRINHMLI